MKPQAFGYLDLASINSVGTTLLSGAPAFVFAADGSRILFANAAGIAFFGER